MSTLASLAADLRRLHQGPMLVLPNAWDVASARVVEEAGYAAVATSSAAVAAVLGHPDGEGAPWQDMFAAVARVAAAVDVPVTVDAEGGYGMAPADLVHRLLEAGAAGCNLEDTDHVAGGLEDPEAHGDWLAAVRAAADDAGVPLVLNARVDVFLPTSGVADADRVTEALRRGRRYLDAGADCVYPIGVTDPDTLRRLVDGLAAPVNANSSPRLGLPALRSMGVARVSYGPRFHREALAGFAATIAALGAPE